MGTLTGTNLLFITEIANGWGKLHPFMYEDLRSSANFAEFDCFTEGWTNLSSSIGVQFWQPLGLGFNRILSRSPTVQNPLGSLGLTIFQPNPASTDASSENGEVSASAGLVFGSSAAPSAEATPKRLFTATSAVSLRGHRVRLQRNKESPQV